jgi:hypothetical protein
MRMVAGIIAVTLIIGLLMSLGQFIFNLNPDLVGTLMVASIVWGLVIIARHITKGN